MNEWTDSFDPNNGRCLDEDSMNQHMQFQYGQV